MSNSVRPHRWQPTRLPRPWDSPGKNTGVGCHFLLQCMKVKSESEVAHSCPTLATPWTAAYQAPLSIGFSRQEYWSGLPCPPPRNLPNSRIEPMSPVQGLNLWLLQFLYCGQILYHWATREVLTVSIADADSNGSLAGVWHYEQSRNLWSLPPTHHVLCLPFVCGKL